MVELSEFFATLRKEKDPPIEVRKSQGEVSRKLETRCTLRFSIANKNYFLEWHRGTIYRETTKNLLSFRTLALDANREWNAIYRSISSGVGTTHDVVFDETGWNLVKKIPLIIIEDLTLTISLEDCCVNQCVGPPHPCIKRMLIQCVADIVRVMHLGGANHRDCHICHFLLHLPFDDKNGDSLKISVIDLHRVQIRNKAPLRWRNKDLIGLYFSSGNIRLTVRGYYRSLEIRFDCSPKDVIRNEGVFIEQVGEKARSIRERTIRKLL